MSEFRGLNARRAYVLTLTYSDDVCDVAPGTIACAGLYTPSDYQQLDAGDWISLISPLNGIAMLRPAGITHAAYSYIKRTHMYDDPPTAIIHPGFLCELLYDGEHYSEFVKLVTDSKIARDYLDALIPWPGLSDTKRKDAHALVRVSAAKNAAVAVLRELGL